MENSNIKIPTILFQDALRLLENLSVMDLEKDSQELYKSVFVELKRKQNNIRLRSFYALVAAAKSVDERQAALSNYLNEKQSSELWLSHLRMRLDNSTSPGYDGLRLRMYK